MKTDHILFIAAGAFHMSKPSDLIPELQGRFPIRVELSSLTEDERKGLIPGQEVFFRGALQHAWGPVWATLAFALLHSGPGRTFLAWTLILEAENRTDVPDVSLDTDYGNSAKQKLENLFD